MELKGRLAVVTGASRGIGAATARLLAREGARVVLVARSREVLEAVAAGIRAAGGEAHVVVADLGVPGAESLLEQEVVGVLGAPDLLVNNAGAGRWLFTEETSPEEAVGMMAAPYFAAFFATRAFLPKMLERGSGLIVNVNSPVALMPWPGATGYAGARWALRGLTEALRQDVAGTGVGVMHFVPGKTSSTYFEHNPGSEERIPHVAKVIPTLTPEEAAAALVGGVQRGAREVVVPFMLRLFWIFERPFPGLTRWLLRATGVKHPRSRR
ncbi:MAG: SDR family NAD(P)-dependent oxidoreductase [Thermoanaerobaculia bacterium]